MSEAKMIIPAYVRIGKCEDCGADIYATETWPAEGGLPLMSACACRGGPKAAGIIKARRIVRLDEADSDKQAQAA
ncbi:MAG: hypothetical protein WCD76_21845 [Pyrinomonadaceae bacterium]